MWQAVFFSHPFFLHPPTPPPPTSVSGATYSSDRDTNRDTNCTSICFPTKAVFHYFYLNKRFLLSVKWTNDVTHHNPHRSRKWPEGCAEPDPCPLSQSPTWCQYSYIQKGKKVEVCSKPEHFTFVSLFVYFCFVFVFPVCSHVCFFRCVCVHDLVWVTHWVYWARVKP